MLANISKNIAPALQYISKGMHICLAFPQQKIISFQAKEQRCVFELHGSERLLSELSRTGMVVYILPQKVGKLCQKLQVDAS